jgi:hypothetical protein
VREDERRSFADALVGDVEPIRPNDLHRRNVHGRTLDPSLQFRLPEREDRPADRSRERKDVVFVRVVRFTDVTAERVQSLVARIDETGPPPGVPIKKLELVFDEAQGTAVVLQYFDSEADLRTGGETFAAMDPSDTPGRRVSVDTGELAVERGL